MRRVFSTVAMMFGILFLGMTSAQAATFDGSDLNPEFMTGITQISAQATDGTPVVLQVFSLPYCINEDGSGQGTDCVWVSSHQGNRLSHISVAYWQGKQVYISNWAAEILVATGATTAPVDQHWEDQAGWTAPVQKYWGDSTTNTDGVNLPACAYEGQNGCYWDAQTMGNGMGHDYVVDVHGNVTYQEVAPDGPTGVSAAESASNGFEPVQGGALTKCTDTIVRSCYNSHVYQYVQSDGTMRYLQGDELGLPFTN